MFNAIRTKVKYAFNRKFNLWLTNRIPAKATHVLNNKSIFIFPTRLGFSYLFVLILLFLLGTNYQNNVIILISYLMASLFITVMMQSFFNFSGLTCSSNQEFNGFANQTLSIPIALNTNNDKTDLHFSLVDQEEAVIDSINTKLDVSIPFKMTKRGVFSPGRVKVESEYSLGLFKTWSWLDFGYEIIVFPEPLALKDSIQSHAKMGDYESTAGQSIKGLDDFSDLSTYKEGDPLSRVAWKHFARGQGKLIKNYQENLSDDKWLCIKDMPSNNVETKLRFLSFLILQYSREERRFGLDLGELKLTPETGNAHLLSCLTALSYYPKIPLSNKFSKNGTEDSFSKYSKPSGVTS